MSYNICELLPLQKLIPFNSRSVDLSANNAVSGNEAKPSVSLGAIAGIVVGVVVVLVLAAVLLFRRKQHNGYPQLIDDETPRRANTPEEGNIQRLTPDPFINPLLPSSPALAQTSEIRRHPTLPKYTKTGSSGSGSSKLPVENPEFANQGPVPVERTDDIPGDWIGSRLLEQSLSGK